MNKKIIFISSLSSVLISTITFFLGKKISEKKINKSIKLMGNLNVTIDDEKPELFLELNEDTIDNIKHAKYAVFNIKLLTNKKIDA